MTKELKSVQPSLVTVATRSLSPGVLFSPRSCSSENTPWAYQCLVANDERANSLSVHSWQWRWSQRWLAMVQPSHFKSWVPQANEELRFCSHDNKINKIVTNLTIQVQVKGVWRGDFLLQSDIGCIFQATPSGWSLEGEFMFEPIQPLQKPSAGSPKSLSLSARHTVGFLLWHSMSTKILSSPTLGLNRKWTLVLYERRIVCL